MAPFDRHWENARKAPAPGGIAPDPGYTASQQPPDDAVRGLSAPTAVAQSSAIGPGTAAAALHESLPAALEPELRRIIDSAVARVAEVEIDTIRESRLLTQGVEHESREALKLLLDHAFQLTESFRLLTNTIAGMVETLDAELDDSLGALCKVHEPESELSRELDTRNAAAQAAGSPEPQAAPEQAIVEEPAPEEPATEEPATEEPAPVAARPASTPAALPGGGQRADGGAAEPVTPFEPGHEMTEMFREQILNMKRSGKSREESERSLLRFNLGRRFVGLLDDVYSADAPERPRAAANDRSKGAVRRFLFRG